MFVSAIIAAGGRGLRVGSSQPKQLLAIGGRPMLERSVAAFLGHPLVDEVIVALPRDLANEPPRYLRDASKSLRIVAGGERRQDSVMNAFRVVAERTDVVVIHDAARPFVSADVIAKTIGAAMESGAALAAVQSRDTVKSGKLVLRQAQDEPGRGVLRHAQDERRSGDGGFESPLHVSLSKDEHRWIVHETLPRESIFLAQTPQAFRREVLRDALALDVDATDEAALAERAGYAVRLVEGEPFNIKITTKDDLAIAEAIAGGGVARPAVQVDRENSSVESDRVQRIGNGYDLHRLVEGRPLVLGGVPIPSDRGALGHSDADVVCHSVTDALLGAAGLGDIGAHFPDSDPRWKNASSVDLLARAFALVAEQSFEVGNVDVTVLLERPKLRPHIEAMRQAVAASIHVDASRVSIKAKTNEGVDAIGRGEAIAAYAIALLRTR